MMKMTKKKKSSKTHQFNFMDLPTEIMFEILSRLSFKSKIRCLACNSKEFNNVISKSNTLDHPHTLFVYKHLDKTKIKLVEYRDNNNMAVTRIDLGDLIREPQSPKSKSFNVLCSYNGLLLVQLNLRPYSECSPEPKVHLLNPMTRQSLILPEPLEPPQFFKRLKGQVSYGLGYSRKTGQLKVVRLSTIQRCHKKRNRCCTEVLDLGCGWRQIEWDKTLCSNVMFQRRLFCFGSQVVLNGAIHWQIRLNKCIFLRFDIDEEKFDLVDFTFLDRTDYDVDMYGLLGNSLYVSISKRKMIEIWVMNEYGVKESWTKLYDIPDNRCCREMLHVFGDGKILIKSRGWIYLYNLIPCNEEQKYASGKKLEMFKKFMQRQRLQVLPFVPNLN